MPGALISCRNLTRIYQMGESRLKALDDVSLDIEAGEFVAVTGASGSGKSTLMNMIGGLDRPSSGTVSINGSEMSTMKPSDLARFRNETIGFIFQQFQLLQKKSALENVMLPLRYRRPAVNDMNVRARESLERVGLGDRARHRPTELSGGQQQRVAIARALAGDPKVILADEPTGALDSGTSQSIMDLLVDLNERGNTIVLITHYAHVASFARRRLDFCDGRIQSDHRSARA